MTIETSLADFEQSRLERAVRGPVYSDEGGQIELGWKRGLVQINIY